MPKKLAIFCDFDGTITEKDNIIDIMKHFAPPEWKEITDQILGQQISIRKGVGQLFQLLSSNLKDEITQYVIQNAKIRNGFQEFIEYCKTRNIQLLITSGGIDFFVYPILTPYLPKEQIYCNHSSFAGERIEILWPHPCDESCTNNCGLCKATILRQYPAEQYFRIVIGDSVTDLAAAKIANFTIARHYLLEKCKNDQLPHAEFHDFYDVIHVLKVIERRLNNPLLERMSELC